MASPVELVKERLAIQEVVSNYLKLEPAGANLRTRCPFHQERTPSFFVSPTRGGWHCFGCGRGGDIFSFVQEIEGLTFPEALQLLAERAGVQIGPLDQARRTQEGKIIELLRQATEFFAEQLTKEPGAQTYLRERGLQPEIVKTWRLGWAPDGWRATGDYFRQKGWTNEDLMAAGLITEAKFLDRFRGRIMFPIFSASGRVIGFSGRLLREREGEGKYINSPQTAFFDKSRVLYGYDRAKTTMRRKNRAVLVEGQVDLLLAHQAGTEEAVATSGTALTREHLNLVRRLSDEIVIAYDADLAGRTAARKAAELALTADLNVRLVDLPTGEDPAALISRRPDDWRKRLEQAEPLVNFWFNLIKKESPDGRTRNLRVSREVIPLVARLPRPLEQAHYLELISRELSVPEAVLWEEIKKSPAGEVDTETVSMSTPVVLTRRQRIERRLVGLFWLGTIWPEERRELEALTGAAYWVDLESKFTVDREAILLEIDLLAPSEEEKRKEAVELIWNFTTEWWQDKLQTAFLALKSAERQNDQKTVEKFLQECQQISQNLEKLKAAGHHI